MLNTSKTDAKTQNTMLEQEGDLCALTSKNNTWAKVDSTIVETETETGAETETGTMKTSSHSHFHFEFAFGFSFLEDTPN